MMKLPRPFRILILGNSASGKSFLAERLAGRLGLERFAMDDLRWKKRGSFRQRPDADVEKDLLEILRRENFVIEGVYGEMARMTLGGISLLLWLDIDPEVCVASAIARGFDHIPWLSNRLLVSAYLKHVRSYGSRLTPHMARECHESIFRDFGGEKRAFATREEVGRFLAEVDASASVA